MGDRLLSKTRSSAEKPGDFRMCLICELQGSERTLLELRYNSSGELDMPTVPDDSTKMVKKCLIQNQNRIDLTSRHRSITKAEFFATAKKLPFVYDCLRHETMWQDRQATAGEKPNWHGLKPKQKARSRSALPVFTVFLHAEEKILVFRFQQEIDGKLKNRSQKFQELVPGQVYQLELPSLHFEDIVFDLRE
jgi:hypothetical protein